MRTLRNIALFVAPVILFGGAACGSESGNDGAGNTETTSVTSKTSTTSADAESESDSGPSTPVAITDFAYTPARIEIAAGTKVTWTNNDKFLHTVTSGATDGPENVPDGMFDEDLAEAGSTASVTFDKPGTYTYYCKQHNAMDGTITVT